MKAPEYIQGFTLSVWKSLAVKSLRLGWPAGLTRAEQALGKSAMKLVLTCGVFEDIFPAVAELRDVMREVRTLDYTALCSRQTHHGRGYTAEFCGLRERSMDAAQNHKPELWAAAKRHGIWLPLRALNCFWTWLEIEPTDAGQTRPIDKAPWTGMPEAVLDGHTYEGKVQGKNGTLLSGHYENHRRLSEIVTAQGWQILRRQVHASIVPGRSEGQRELFQFNP